DAHTERPRARVRAHGRIHPRHQRAHARPRQATRVRGDGEPGGPDGPHGSPRSSRGSLISAASQATMSNDRVASLPVPVPDWIRGYQSEWAKPDIIAGLTPAAVVLPKAMAYATIAGLPVQVGLYTAFLPMVIYAVLGTSRPLSVSTTTTLAILAAAAFGELAP